MLCSACGADLSDGTPLCGRCGAPPLLEGRYRLEAILGAGANGTTYRATRVADGQAVAIKELSYRKVEAVKRLELFDREAEALRSLDHPAIPRFVDSFTREQGKQVAIYIVEALVVGETLEQERQHRRYDARQVLDVLEPLLEVLSYLHAQTPPVLHRDIKPANLMRAQSPDGRPGRLVLIDFGSVRVSAEPAAGGSTIAGTFGYMAPEQLRGQASPASDLYALGVLAVALYARVEPETLHDHHHRFQWRAALAGAPPALARFLATLLEPEVDRRASDAAQVQASLRRLRYQLATGGDRRGVPAHLLGAAVAAAALGGGLWLSRPRAPQRAPLQAQEESPVAQRPAAREGVIALEPFQTAFGPRDVEAELGSVLADVGRCAGVWGAQRELVLRGFSRSYTLEDRGGGHMLRRADHLRLLDRAGTRLDDESAPSKYCVKSAAMALPGVEPGVSLVFSVPLYNQGGHLAPRPEGITTAALVSQWRVRAASGALPAETTRLVVATVANQAHKMCVEMNFDQLQYFYEHQGYTQSAEVQIDRQGHVREVKLLGAELRDTSHPGNLQRCLQTVLRGLSFPPASGPSEVSVDYTLAVRASS